MRIVLAVIVLVVAVTVAAWGNRSLDADLRSASETTSTEFKTGTDYDLGEVYVLDGWESYRGSKYSSSRDTTGFEVFIMFKSRDNVCIALLNVTSSNSDTFKKLKEYADDDSRTVESSRLNVIASAEEIPSNRRSELNTRIDDFEKTIGVTCTPVYTSFEFITDSQSKYAADKRSVVGQHGAGAIAVGVIIASLLMFGAIRKMMAINRAEEALHRSANSAPAPAFNSGPNPGPMPTQQTAPQPQQPTLRQPTPAAQPQQSAPRQQQTKGPQG